MTSPLSKDFLESVRLSSLHLSDRTKIDHKNLIRCYFGNRKYLDHHGPVEILLRKDSLIFPRNVYLVFNLRQSLHLLLIAGSNTNGGSTSHTVNFLEKILFEFYEAQPDLSLIPSFSTLLSDLLSSHEEDMRKSSIDREVMKELQAQGVVVEYVDSLLDLGFPVDLYKSFYSKSLDKVLPTKSSNHPFTPGRGKTSPLVTVRTLSPFDADTIIL